MKKSTILSVILLLCGIHFVNAVSCPDLIVTSVSITRITQNAGQKTINYKFTIKNNGSEAINFKEILIQNYVAPDSLSNILQASGGSFMWIFDDTTQSIAPGASYSGTYYAGYSNSYPFLVVMPHLQTTTECDINNNYFYRRITNNFCPDLIFTSLSNTRTSITGETRLITYDFTIKNIGTDTAFLNDIVLQDYVSTDSTASTAVGAGGTNLSGLETKIKYLAPQVSYSGTFSSSDNKTYSFLVHTVYFSKALECNSTDNTYIQRITNTSTGIKSLSQGELVWNPVFSTFKINGNAPDFKYVVFDMKGRICIKGESSANENISLKLQSGIYFIEVRDNARKLTKKIAVY